MRVVEEVAQTVEPFVARTVGDHEVPLVEHAHEARRVALGRDVAAPRRVGGGQQEERRVGDELPARLVDEGRFLLDRPLARRAHQVAQLFLGRYGPLEHVDPPRRRRAPRDARRSSLSQSSRSPRSSQRSVWSRRIAYGYGPSGDFPSANRRRLNASMSTVFARPSTISSAMHDADGGRDLEARAAERGRQIEAVDPVDASEDRVSVATVAVDGAIAARERGAFHGRDPVRQHLGADARRAGASTIGASGSRSHSWQGTPTIVRMPLSGRK